MPIDFPNSPSVNDQFVSGGRTWIWDGSVWKAYTQALSNATVTTAILADDAVTSAKIANGTIATEDLADSAITSAKIADGTIVNGDIASNAAISTTKVTGWEDDQVILSSQFFS